MPIIIDSYSESNQNAILYMSGGDVKGIGQSFNAGAAVPLTSAKFSLSKESSPTGNAYAKLYVHSGTYGTSSIPTGAALATSSSLDVSTLTAYQVIKEFTFASPYTLTAGTKYVLTIEYTGTGGWVRPGVDSTTPTHGGNSCIYSAQWDAYVQYDCCFYAYNTGIKSVAGVSFENISKVSNVPVASISKVSGLN